MFIVDNEENAIKYDAECIKRRQIFFDKLKQYQREMKAGHQKASTQYKSVVSEFELLESENPLVALFNKMFITGRKLRPVVQKRQPVALDSCKEAKIMIHIIKGFNVPIRNSAKQDIMMTVNRQGIGNMMNRNMANPYGGSRAGPFPVSMNQFQGSNNPMMMSGMPQSFDPRSSLGRSGVPPFTNDLRMTNTRMTAGVPLSA